MGAVLAVDFGTKRIGVAVTDPDRRYIFTRDTLLRATPVLEITIVVAGGDDRAARDRTAAMLDRSHRHPHPNRVIMGGDPGDPVIAALPAMEGRLAHTGHAFVCSGSTCLEPVTSPEGLDAALARAGTFRGSAE